MNSRQGLFYIQILTWRYFFSYLVQTQIQGNTDEFSYIQSGEHATNLVGVHTQNGTRTRYIYDENSNIREIRDGFNRQLNKYEYDELGRLVRDAHLQWTHREFN